MCVARFPRTSETSAPNNQRHLSITCDPIAPSAPPPCFTSDHQFHGRAGSARESERKRSEEHTSELQSLTNLVCRLLLEKKRIARSICHPRDPCSHADSAACKLGYPHECR